MACSKYSLTQSSKPLHGQEYSRVRGGRERRRSWSAQGLFQSHLPRSSAKPGPLSPRLLHLPLFPSYTSLPSTHSLSPGFAVFAVDFGFFNATCSVRPFTATASWWCCQGLSASLFAISRSHFKVPQIAAQNGLIERYPSAPQHIITEKKDNRFKVQIIDPGTLGIYHSVQQSTFGLHQLTHLVAGIARKRHSRVHSTRGISRVLNLFDEITTKQSLRQQSKTPSSPSWSSKLTAPSGPAAHV